MEILANERRTTKALLEELELIGARAVELNVGSDAADFDVGWTTDDLLARAGTSPTRPSSSPPNMPVARDAARPRRRLS